MSAQDELNAIITAFKSGILTRDAALRWIEVDHTLYNSTGQPSWTPPKFASVDEAQQWLDRHERDFALGA